METTATWSVEPEVTWGDKAGLALLGAVFGASCRDNAVLRRVNGTARELERRGLRTDSLKEVAALDENFLAEFMGRSRLNPGRRRRVSRAEAARAAAGRIAALGVDTAADVRAYARRAGGAEDILRSYSSVAGLGRVSGERFLALLGAAGPEGEA